jgi:hypothetical protein
LGFGVVSYRSRVHDSCSWTVKGVLRRVRNLKSCHSGTSLHFKDGASKPLYRKPFERCWLAVNVSTFLHLHFCLKRFWFVSNVQFLLHELCQTLKLKSLQLSASLVRRGRRGWVLVRLLKISVLRQPHFRSQVALLIYYDLAVQISSLQELKTAAW